MRKFYHDPSSGTMLRFILSSKSITGVLVDMEVLDLGGDGVRMLGTPTGNFTESFIKIQLQEPCQDSSNAADMPLLYTSYNTFDPLFSH